MHYKGLRFTCFIIPMVALACGEKGRSVEDAIVAAQKKVGPKLESIEAIAEQLPAVDGDKWFGGPALHIIENIPRRGRETVMIYDTDLKALVNGVRPRVNVDRHPRSDTVPQCWFAIRKKQFGWFRIEDGRPRNFTVDPLKDGKQVESACAYLNEATHIAVVHVSGKVEPKSTSMGTFEQGQVTGHVDVFELRGSKFLGRHPFTGKNSDLIISDPDEPMSSAARRDKNLAENTHQAIEKALTGRL